MELNEKNEKNETSSEPVEAELSAYEAWTAFAWLTWGAFFIAAVMGAETMAAWLIGPALIMHVIAACKRTPEEKVTQRAADIERGRRAMAKHRANVTYARDMNTLYGPRRR